MNISYSHFGHWLTRTFALLCLLWLTMALNTQAFAAANITPAGGALPNATVGQSYTFPLQVSGGAAPYAGWYQCDNNSPNYDPDEVCLPPGLVIDESWNSSTTNIRGTPSSAGTYTFTIGVWENNSSLGASSATYTLTVLPAGGVAPITNPVSMTVSANSSSNLLTLSLSGGAPTTLTAGPASNGTAVVSGMRITYTPNPGYSGSDSFTYTATNSSGTSTPATVSVTVLPPTLLVSPISLPNATAGSAYTFGLSASAGTAPYTFSTSGSLPNGLTLTGSTLSGTPTQSGAFTFTVTATDANGATGSRSYNINVAAPTIVIAPTILSNGTSGTAYSDTLTAIGGTAPYTYTTNVLPAGLNLSSNGNISGTPTMAGSFNIMLTATDANGFTGSQAYILSIAAAPLTITTTTLTPPVFLTAYSQQLAASGGTTPYSFALDSGMLPSGMVFSSSGILSGTPTAAGTFNFTIRVTDTSNVSHTRAYTFTIAPPTLVMSPATLPEPVVNTAYSQSLTTSGGLGGYTYTVASGNLPTGLSLSASGVLSGTPTASGSYTFDVRSTDTSTVSVTRRYTLVVDVPTIHITPITLSTPLIYTPYSTNFSASGGTAPYTYSLTAGAIPTGLNLSSNGTLSGTPTASGTFNFTITASDVNGFSGARAYSLSIAPPTLAITPATLGNGTAGTAYSQNLSSSGGNLPYSYVVSSGTLPAGMSLSTSGTLSGTPTVSGHFAFDVRSTDAGAFSVTQNYTLVINAPTIAVSPTNVSTPLINTAYSDSVSASGGAAPYTYAITSGSLPTGLSLSASGVVSGTATAVGNFNITVTATDANGFTGSRSYSLSVSAPTLGITPTTLGNGTAGTAYSQSFSSGGGTAPYSYTMTSGSLPTGLNLSSSGTLSGTPTASGSNTFTVTSTDSGGFSVTQPYTLVIDAPTVAISAGSLSTPLINTAYSDGVSASGGAAPYAYTITAGSLPSGLNLSTNGTVSGTPSAAGLFSFTITATDANGFSGTRSYTFNIAAPTVTLSSGSLGTPVINTAYSDSVSASGGTAPYAYTLATGSLPTGLSLSSNGTVSGTPRAAGSFSFTISATDANGFSGAQSYTFVIAAPTVTVAPTALNTPVINAAYSDSISASGGTAPYTYAITAGTAPTGLNLSTSGTLSGTPSAAGNFSFTVSATDANGFIGTRSYAQVVSQAAPVATGSSLSVVGGSSANPVTLTLSGGPVTSVSVVANASNGTASASGTGITYTPDAGYAGSDSFSYQATGPGGTSNVAVVNVTVTAPSVVIGTASLSNATQGSTYSGSLSASGGTAPYTFSTTSGSLPTGISLSSAGVFSGTPTVSGTFNFTITTTDANGFSGARAYSLVIAAQAPVAGAVTATVAANSSNNALTLNLGTAQVTSVAVASAPTNGSAVASGTRITYTPNSGYSGADSFTYTATGPGGTSAPATVSLTISAPSLVLSPASGTLDPGTVGSAYRFSVGATGGTAPYSYAIAAGSLPTGLSLDTSTGEISGTPTQAVSGNLTVTVTDANGATGSRSFALVIAAQAVTVVSSEEVVLAGGQATVDLSRGASGGPFLRASMLSVSPASAGRFTLSGFDLRFVPAAAFAGKAVVRFSLHSASASATGTVTFAVQARPDPSKDPEVIGLLNAQSRAADRFASTQMENFNRRLEQLHKPTCDRNSFNASVKHGREDLSLGDLGKALRDEIEGNGKGADSDDDARRREKDSARASSGECQEDALAYWTDGFVNTGSTRARGADDNSFVTYGLSAGMDYRLSSRAVVGVGIGYGNDRADIGDNDTRSDADALGLAAYLSVNPLSEVYIDALLGYNRIRFDSRRYISADASNPYAHGSRDADQLFASLTTSYEYRHGALSLAPYARVNASLTTLDAFNERGGGIYGLSYEEQRQRTFTSFLGVRSGYDIVTGAGVLTPRVGLAWGHNFSHSDDYRMRYTDQGNDGVLYRLSPDPMDSNFVDLDMGVDFSLSNSWRVGLSYKTALGTDERNETFRIGLDGRF